MTPAFKTTLARGCGLAAGIGGVLAGLLHQGFGAPMLEHFLGSQYQTAPALLQQTEASWMSATLSLVLFGAALSLAALKRHGWLYSLGRPIGIWFVGYGASEQWSAARWGVSGLAPEALILWLIAALTFAAAFLSKPSRP